MEESVVESLNRFIAGERDIRFLDAFIDKFPLLFLERHFPAEEQPRFAPLYTEALDVYLRGVPPGERWTEKGLNRMSPLLFKEMSAEGRFAAVDGFLDDYEQYQAVYAASPPRLLKDQYESLAPIYMNILLGRAATSTEKRQDLLSRLQAAEHVALRTMKRILGEDGYAERIEERFAQ